MPRERPQFLTLNFRSGAYHFHRWRKFSFPEQKVKIFSFQPGFYIFAVPETIVFNTHSVQAIILIVHYSSTPPDSSQSASPTTIHAQRMRIFICSSIDPAPLPYSNKVSSRVSSISSGDPHFHARASSGAPMFDFAVAHTCHNEGYTPHCHYGRYTLKLCKRTSNLSSKIIS